MSTTGYRSGAGCTGGPPTHKFMTVGKSIPQVFCITIVQPISGNKKNDNTLDDSSFTLVYLILQSKNSASYTAKQMAITFSMHCLMK